MMMKIAFESGLINLANGDCKILMMPETAGSKNEGLTRSN